jgi:hypothetical protein
MLIAFLCLQNGENSPQKEPLVPSLIYLSKTLDKVYDDFKDWASMFSNKFDVGIVYVFEVGIIVINFKFLLIKTFFFQVFDPKFLASFCCLHFPLNLHYFFPTKFAKVRKFETKNTCRLGGGGLNPTIQTQIFTKLNCVSFHKCKCILTSLKNSCDFFQSCIINH